MEKARGSVEQLKIRGQSRGVSTRNALSFSFRSEPLPGKRECRVGQYVVDLTSFEQLALPVLRTVSVSFCFCSPAVLSTLWESLAPETKWLLLYRDVSFVLYSLRVFK